MQDAPRRILGDFKLLRELGRGGMGVVYLARQLSLGREVALKLLSNEASADPSRLARFQREAALLARLAHPNLVRVFVVGEDGGTHFLAMDFVDGVDFERLTALRRDLKVDLLPAAFRADWARACAAVARDVASGLGAAHAQGIVHRDVKPSNILIANDGRALLADFGIARDLGVEALTNATGALIGTPHYLSPECVRGEPPSPRSDVHALGAVLYEALTGRRPYDAPSVPQLLEVITRDDAPPVRKIAPTVARDLETIVMRCLEKDPARRYADGDALARDLTRFLAGEPIEATAVGTMTRILRRAQRRRAPFLLTLGIGVAAIGLLVWGFDSLVSKQATERDRDRTQLQALLANSDLAGARALLDAALLTDAAREDLRFERAELALREKRWVDAESDYAWLASNGSTDRSAAELGLHLAKRVKERRMPDVPPATPPSSARAARYRSLIRQARREYPESIAENRKALELDPDCIESRYELGAVHFRMREYDDAERELLSYSRVRPGRPETWNLLGQIDLTRKKYDAAISNFERLLKLREDSAPGWNSLAAAHLYRANQLERVGAAHDAAIDHQHAQDALTRAKQIEPNYFLVPFNEALLCCMRGQSDASIDHFRAAVAIGGADAYWGPQMWLGFTEWLIEYQQFKAARALLDEYDAMESAPQLDVDAMREILDRAERGE
jgi:tetratricopeptide (TPR) repeat protein